MQVKLKPERASVRNVAEEARHVVILGEQVTSKSALARAKDLKVPKNGEH